MWKSILLSIGMTSVLAQPGAANDQLARPLGVEPGVYSTSDLIRLKAAYDGDDAARVAAILRQGSPTGRVSTRNVGQSAGHRQLAAALGVRPEDFSTAQLVQLRGAIEAEQRHQAMHIRAGGGNLTVANLSTTDVSNSPGHRQMAASLNVDPAAHSTPALIKMRKDLWAED